MKNKIIKFISWKLIIHLFIIVILFTGFAYFINYKEKLDTIVFVKDCLLGIGTNVLGIIITVMFVQTHLNKESEKQITIRENNSIIRFSKVLDFYFKSYNTFVKALTLNKEERNTKLNSPLPDIIKISDLKDIYTESRVYNYGDESTISLYYQAEEKLRNCFEQMLLTINFEKNTDLKKIIEEFIEISNWHSKKRILDNEIEQQNHEKAMNYLLSEDLDWERRLSENKVPAIAVPYIILVKQINTELQIIKRCQNYFTKINESY